jgi:hypothetical protein
MFLPPLFSIRVSGLPAIDKDLVASLSAILGCLIVKPRVLLRRSKSARGYFGFIVLLIAGAFMTIMTNRDSLLAGRIVKAGLTMSDFFAMAVHDLVYWWPAFFIGMKVFSRTEDLKTLFTALAIGGVIYSFCVFLEIRLSPQLNNWTYGYSQALIGMAKRGDSFRPVVYMRHGLNVALFLAACVLATTGLARARVSILGLPAWAFALYLTIVLVACRSAGAIFYVAALVPTLLWMPARWQKRLAITIAGLVVFYPLLRFLDLIPVDSIVNFFTATAGEERAGSLAFRLTNERALLVKAALRPWFGWGGWGRQFPYSIWGKLAIPDGEWIVVLGESGAVGFLGIFGLLLLPIFRFARKRLSQEASGPARFLGATALFISVAFVFDLLPNAGMAPYLLLIVGALAGAEEEARTSSPGALGAHFVVTEVPPHYRGPARSPS